MTDFSLPPRAALYVPASNARALAKLPDLRIDMAIVELEDAVAPADKDSARVSAALALRGDIGAPLRALRINAVGTPWHDADMAMARETPVDVVVLPKAESAADVQSVIEASGRPVLAMIESAAAIFAAPAIARVAGVAGLIAGSNDIAESLRLPADAGRDGLTVALQSIVLAARAAGVWALDGVYNGIGDDDGLAADCRGGRAFGFDGKTLIHPGHVATANAIFGPDEAAIAEARAIVAAARDGQPGGIGAIRLGDRMIEAMHVAAAERLLRRADAG